MAQKSHVNVDIITISKLVDTKNNFKYLLGYLDEVMSQLVLMLPKISRYIKKFTEKGGDKIRITNWCIYI